MVLEQNQQQIPGGKKKKRRRANEVPKTYKVMENLFSALTPNVEKTTDPRLL